MSADRVRPSMPEPLLRRAQAALFLAVSPRTVARLTQGGLLPCVRLGRAVRYRQGDLNRLVAKSKDNQMNTRRHGGKV
jgi:excisionase family DNA binding protein